MERRTYRSEKTEAPIKREEVPSNIPNNTIGKHEPDQNPSPTEESKFRNITGLFKSKSGKADTVFVKEDMIDKLKAVQPGDVLGVSKNTKNGNLQLWFIPKDSE